VPTGPAASAPTTGGIETSADPTSWRHWWHFNKAPYLDLRRHLFAIDAWTGSDDFFLGRGGRSAALPTLRPSRGLVETRVVPALLRVLAEGGSPDMLTSALIALAKIRPPGDLQQTILPLLVHANQEVSETATVALGILGDAPSTSVLIELMEDTPAGRKLVGKTEVPYRTRSFAAYGLGLIGGRATDNAARQRIAERLANIFAVRRFSTNDLQTAAVTAFGLTPIAVEPSIPPPGPDGERGPYARHVVSRRAQIALLLEILEPKRSKRAGPDRIVRAHSLIALARLLRGAERELKDEVAAALLVGVREHSRAPREAQQSSAIGLGLIGDADDDELDVKIRAALTRLLKRGGLQTRFFAAIALAKVGSRPGDGETPLAGAAGCRRALLLAMTRGRSQVEPWAGLALGVLGRGLLDRDEIPDAGVGKALRSALSECRRPQNVGAYGLALGIRRDADAEGALLEAFGRFSTAEARGELAIALGLVGGRAAVEPMFELLRASKYRPVLLEQAAIGLGLLEHREVVPVLVDMLADADSQASQASIAAALGIIGDVRSVEPLIEMLEGRKHTDTARAFAAVALGNVCDREPLPWNTPMALDVNYRALTSTLLGSARGVLEIL